MSDTDAQTETRLLGHCSVDSGQILLTDPCYVEKGLDYREVCETKYDNADFDNLMVKLAGFGGDGCYPVYGEFDKHGRLISATIKFRG